MHADAWLPTSISLKKQIFFGGGKSNIEFNFQEVGLYQNPHDNPDKKWS